MMPSKLVSVVLPCLNEEEGIESVISKIQQVFSAFCIDGEIIVCDNGSTDRSAQLAESAGATVVREPRRGYGNAYITGFSHARGRYLIMGDADDTYDFKLIPLFLKLLSEEGYSFVSGSRYLGKDIEGMPFLHRYLGNPALTLILNLLFGGKYTDVYCGMRAFTREAYQRISPVSTGMEFNLELAINASLARLKSTEIPIRLGPRKGSSKLRTFVDGWRSLRMMMLYCPNKVFLAPGLALAASGCALLLTSFCGWPTYHGRAFGAGLSYAGSLSCILGLKILSLGLHAKTYSWSRRFDRENPWLATFYSCFTLERGILAGAALLVAGLAFTVILTIHWLESDLLPLAHPQYLSVALLLIVVGAEIVFSSLFISAMSISERPTSAKTSA